MADLWPDNGFGSMWRPISEARYNAILNSPLEDEDDEPSPMNPQAQPYVPKPIGTKPVGLPAPKPVVVPVAVSAPVPAPVHVPTPIPAPVHVVAPAPVHVPAPAPVLASIVAAPVVTAPVAAPVSKPVAPSASSTTPEPIKTGAATRAAKFAARVRTTPPAKPARSVSVTIAAADNTLCDLRGMYGVHVTTDARTEELLSRIQMLPWHDHRDTSKPVSLDNTAPLVPTTGSPVSTNRRKPKRVPRSTVDPILARTGYTVLTEGTTVVNDGYDHAVMKCPAGHQISSQGAMITLPCEICVYTEQLHRGCSRAKYTPLIDSFRRTGGSEAVIPFSCSEGHMFIVSRTESATGECTVCAIIRLYASLGINIKITSGVYSHPQSMLRASCLDCCAEFYLSPADEPIHCIDRHQCSDLTPMIMRVFETIFNARFDEYPLTDTVVYLDGCNCTYQTAFVMEANTCTNTPATRGWCNFNGFNLIVIPQTVTHVFDAVLFVINHITRIIVNTEEKMSFAHAMCALMEKLANANRSLPTRVHPSKLYAGSAK